MVVSTRPSYPIITNLEKVLKTIAGNFKSWNKSCNLEKWGFWTRFFKWVGKSPNDFFKGLVTSKEELIGKLLTIYKWVHIQGNINPIFTKFSYKTIPQPS